MNTPDFEISLASNGQNVDVKTRLVSLTLTDKSGMEADELQIVLTDHDGNLAIPPRGEKINCKIGWKHKPLADKGVFIVDETRHSGPPDIITIMARSADFTEGLKTQKERSFHQTTLGEIINTIASDNNLTPRISSELQNIAISHIDQTTESDANFLTRLTKDYDALASIKNQNLIVMPLGSTTTPAGVPIPVVNITRQSGDSHTFTETERQSQHTGVIAWFNDTEQAKKIEVLHGEYGTVKTLRRIYQDEPTATAAAKAEFQRLKRSARQLQLNIAIGLETLFPETPVNVSGFKSNINDAKWHIKTVTHEISTNGFTSKIQLENGF